MLKDRLVKHMSQINDVTWCLYNESIQLVKK